MTATIQQTGTEQFAEEWRAITDLATCPLPPAENRLPVAVEAGEQIPRERRARA